MLFRSLAVMLTLSLTALGEDEIINSDDLPIFEDIELSESLNDLDIPILNPLSYYDYDDGSYYYTNAYMMIVVSASTNKIEGIMLTSKSSKYTLTGVYPGMSLSSAQATATSAGWSYYQVDGDNYWYRATYQGKSVALIIKKDSYSSTVQSVTML